MQVVVHHEQYGEITYDESFWLGKKSLMVNGVLLNKISKKEFQMQDGSIIRVQGNFIQGISIVVGSETIRLTPKLQWYEIVMGIIPFILIMVWGNTVALCKIVPVVGGAIGGGLSAAFSYIGILLIKKVKPLWLKILIAIAVIGVTFGVCCGIGYAIVGAA